MTTNLINIMIPSNSIRQYAIADTVRLRVPYVDEAQPGDQGRSMGQMPPEPDCVVLTDVAGQMVVESSVVAGPIGKIFLIASLLVNLLDFDKLQMLLGFVPHRTPRGSAGVVCALAAST